MDLSNETFDETWLDVSTGLVLTNQRELTQVQHSRESKDYVNSRRKDQKVITALQWLMDKSSMGGSENRRWHWLSELHVVVTLFFLIRARLAFNETAAPNSQTWWHSSFCQKLAVYARLGRRTEVKMRIGPKGFPDWFTHPISLGDSMGKKMREHVIIRKGPSPNQFISQQCN